MKGKEFKKSITVNLSMWMLLAVFLQVIIADNIIYFTKINYFYANLVALAVNFIINIYLLHRKVQLISQYFKWDILFYSILLTVCILTIGFADRLWDTHSYHIYLQENPFKDKIYEDFFPGRTLTSFVYPVVDRIFFMFRCAGGFRLGTLPSYLVMIPIFYGVKKILKYLIPDSNDKFLSICSIFPICTFILLQQMGTYYIDNFSVIFILEFTYIAFICWDSFFENKAVLLYIAVVCGIAVCIKFTNAVFIIGILFYIALRNIKSICKIKCGDYIALMLIAVIPMLPYFIDAVKQTGSPTFPYYNKIFQSEFFLNENWLDQRFGPDNMLQFIMWPVYILFHPAEAYDLERGLTDIAFASGYLVSLICFCKGIRSAGKHSEPADQKKWVLSLILLYYYLVWEKFAIGYTRYAGIIPVLGTIFIICLLWDGLKKRKKFRSSLCVIEIAVSILISGIGYCAFCAPRYYVCYFIPAVAEIFGETAPELKLKHAFNMFGKDKDNLSYDIDGIWGAIGDDSMAPQFLNVDDKIVHLEYGVKTGETDTAQKQYWENVLNNEIYVPVYGDKIDDKLGLLDTFHFELVGIKDVIYDAGFIQGDQTIWIIQVRYNESHYNGNQEKFQSGMIK